MSLWSLMALVPKNIVSRLIGILVEISWPAKIQIGLNRWFVGCFGINMAEAELPLESYRSIQAVFTRKLKKEARPIEADLVHPADSVITEFGRITDSVLIQTKGITYSAQDFLKSEASQFEGGQFITYYLCPSDYHRVHSPVSGTVVKAHYIPGHLWPVNSWSVAKVPGLFAINERMVVWLETAKGLVVLVLVGATNVGKMSLSFDSSIVGNMGQDEVVKSYKPGLQIKAGDELGVFNMGSTVIMLYPKSYEILPTSGQVFMGAKL